METMARPRQQVYWIRPGVRGIHGLHKVQRSATEDPVSPGAIELIKRSCDDLPVLKFTIVLDESGLPASRTGPLRGKARLV